MSSIKKRPDGKWRARYRDETGREHSKHFDRKADAQRWVDHVTTSIVTGTYVDPAAGRVTFKAYAESWRVAQPHRPTTAQNVNQHLSRYAYPVLGEHPMRALRPSQVQAFATGLGETLAPSTIKVVMNTVRAVFRAAVRDRVIATNPCEGLVLPERPRVQVHPLDLEVVQRIVAAFPDEYRAAVVVAAGCGLRQGEVLGLERGHIDFLRRTLRVEQQVQQDPGGVGRVCPPKTRSSYRTIPLPQVVVDELAAHLARYPRDGLLFTAATGGPVIRTRFNDSAWRPAVKAAGVTGVTFHDLRHFYASVLIRAGLSVRVVADRLGHADASLTLNVYAHLWPDEEDRTRSAVDALFEAAADQVRTEDPAHVLSPAQTPALRRSAGTRG